MFDLSTVRFNGLTPMTSLIAHAKTVLSKQLRDYQLEATLFAIAASVRNLKPLLIEVPTGGGKSWICVSIAYVISLIFQRAGHDNRRTLIICPTDTLVEQNADKLRRAGGDVAIFCASLKLKQTEGTIIVGTPVSIANAIELFATLNIGCVIVDEAHGHADTSKGVVAALRSQNPLLREFGMTATPFRMMEKYIYRVNSYEKLPPNGPDLAVEPYYDELVYRVAAERLIRGGYMVPMLVKSIGAHYDTSLLKLGTAGKFTSESEREVFLSRATNVAIVADMLESTKDRKMIMVFCQNIEHAELIYALLTERMAGKKKWGSAVLYHSKVDKEVGRNRLHEFSEGKHRFMISVRSLTTGYDNERVDGIVVLSTTESASLIVQILGRGMRPILSDRRCKKTHCCLYDYGQNVPRHFPEGDLLKPYIRPVGDGINPVKIFLKYQCPCCGVENQSGASAWYERLMSCGYTVNQHGYFVAPEGEVMHCPERRLPVSAHLQTQCCGLMEQPDGKVVKCPHTWTGQLCDVCGLLNNNDAEQCVSCDADFRQRRDQERGRSGLSAIRIPEPVKANGIYEVVQGRVSALRVSVQSKRDRRGVEYLRGTLHMTVTTRSGLVMEDGKVRFQSGLIEPVWVHFDEHHDYVQNAKGRKLLIMKALWGQEISMRDVLSTPINREVKSLEYFWAKLPGSGWKYADILRLRSVERDSNQDGARDI